MTWSCAADAHAVFEPELTVWSAAGGMDGRLGLPTTDRVCGLRSGGCYQEYEGGSIVTGPGTGTRVVPDLIHDSWVATGRESGRLGYPVADEVCGLREGGCVQQYQGGSIYRDPFGRAHVIDGAILARWRALGGENGHLGYPDGNARCGFDRGGCLQDFRGGVISWSPATGAQTVDGAILAIWGSMGSANSRYGYPVAGARCGLRDGGCLQQLQAGHIYWSPQTWAAAVDGAIFATWGSMGYENGRYGYPLSNARCGVRGGGCVQEFQRGSIFLEARHRCPGRGRRHPRALGLLGPGERLPRVPGGRGAVRASERWVSAAVPGWLDLLDVGHVRPGRGRRHPLPLGRAGLRERAPRLPGRAGRPPAQRWRLTALPGRHAVLVGADGAGPRGLIRDRRRSDAIADQPGSAAVDRPPPIR